MQIIRTLAWIVVTAVLVAFIAMNWTTVPVNFWPLDDGNYIHFEWPVGIVALVFFLIGVGPAWLYVRAVRWRSSRRIASLENSLRASSLPSINARVPDAPSTAPEPQPSVSSSTPES
jgi:uncharacterized integral membrane protein